MKLIIPSLFAFAIATSSFAADPAAEKPSQTEGVKVESINTVCPVSGEKVGGDMGKPVYVDYKGKKIGFCCRDCAKDFKKNPEKYAALAEKNRSSKSEQ
jgi:YHS domain-containing protein